MSDIEPKSISEINALAGATRYAEAITVAAAAGEKVDALTKLLAESEFYRQLAEDQLNTATWPEGVGQILHEGTDGPGEDVAALVDIYSGKVYARRAPYVNEIHSTDWVEVQMGERPFVTYRWPIQDAGPFLKIKDDWFLYRQMKEAAELQDWRRKINETLSREPGYYGGEDARSIFKNLPEALSRILLEKSAANGDLTTKNAQLTRDLERANRELEQWRAADAQRASAV